MELNSKNVFQVFARCLLREGEENEGSLEVEALTVTLTLHVGRLMKHKADILDMLHQLPECFESSSGASFVKASFKRSGEQWTRNHREVEALIILGLGAGVLSCPLPKRLWNLLPDGMPRYCMNA